MKKKLVKVLGLFLILGIVVMGPCGNVGPGDDHTDPIGTNHTTECFL